MTVDILTLEKTLLSGEFKSVIVPGASGRFEMLNNHAPVVSLLTKGTIQITNQNNEKSYIDIIGGSMEMSNNKITILAETE